MSNSVQDVIAVDYVGGVCVATVLVRELNSSNSEELSSRLLALLNDGKSTKFILDLEAVRARRVDRPAVAMVGLAELLPCRL